MKILSSTTFVSVIFTLGKHFLVPQFLITALLKAVPRHLHPVAAYEARDKDDVTFVNLVRVAANGNVGNLVLRGILVRDLVFAQHNGLGYPPHSKRRWRSHTNIFPRLLTKQVFRNGHQAVLL